MKTLDMELALARHFDCRRNIIVPNVSWGLELHECDLLVLTKSGYAYEVEIKISKADLLADKKKRHKHNSDKIKYLYFAVPVKLLDCIEHIPERAGVISVTEDRGYYRCKVVRKPECWSRYKWLEGERSHLMHLGVMRVWSLKKRIKALED